MSEPQVSVVIPVFARHDQVLTAVRSALSQTDVELEVVVVDDGSTPPIDLSTIEDRRLRLLRHEENLGPAVARNTGLAAARGSYIAFLDSDDTWLPEKLSAQLLAAATGTSFAVVTTGWYNQYNGTVRTDALIPHPAIGIDAFASGTWFAAGSTSLIPRTAFDIIGVQDANLVRLEDYDWFIRFAAAGGELVVVPTPLAIISWRRHDDWPEIDAACRRLAHKYLRRDSGLGSATKRRIRALLLLSRASRRWYARRRTAALALLLGSWLLRPRGHWLLVRPARQRR